MLDRVVNIATKMIFYHFQTSRNSLQTGGQAHVAHNTLRESLLQDNGLKCWVHLTEPQEKIFRSGYFYFTRVIENPPK